MIIEIKITNEFGNSNKYGFGSIEDATGFLNSITIHDNHKDLGCPDCSSPYPDGEYEAHFMGCPRKHGGN